MYQLAKEVKDKRIKANLYVDDWPKFTTVISQEFTPRLSEVIKKKKILRNALSISYSTGRNKYRMRVHIWHEVKLKVQYWPWYCNQSVLISYLS